MRKDNKLFKFGAVLLCAVLFFCMMPMSAKAANYDSCTHHQMHDEACGGTADKCDYICEVCASNIEEMLAVLPAMDEIDTNDEVQVAAVGAQLSAIDAVRCGLSDAAVT